VLAYVLWTIKCVKDFIDDVHSDWKLWFLFEAGTSWSWWIIIHAIAILSGSLAYFLLMKGCME
jgi:hypothetical protein